MSARLEARHGVEGEGIDTADAPQAQRGSEAHSGNKADDNIVSCA